MGTTSELIAENTAWNAAARSSPLTYMTRSYTEHPSRAPAMAAPVAHTCSSREEVVAVLREQYPDLAREFRLSTLALFGSFARDEQTASTDVDILVSFVEPIGFGFMHLADRLEGLLGRKVDLVATDGIKENRRPFILSSLVHVAP